MRAFRPAILTALAIALATGTSAQASPELSKQRYIAQADAICASAAEQVRKLAPATTSAKVAAIGGRLAINRRALADVRALTQPPADRATVASAIRLADVAINNGIAGVISAAKAGNAASYRAAVKRASAMIAKAHAAARAYGFSACARW